MQSVWNKIKSNEFYQGGVILTISTVLINFFSYLFSLIAARILGPQGFGELSAFNSYIYITSVPLNVLGMIIIQKISSTEYSRLAYTLTLESFFWEKIKRWWYFIPLLFIAIPFIPHLTNLTLITSLFLILFIIVSFLNSFYQAALQGLRLFLIFSVIGVIGTLVKLMGAVIAIPFPHLTVLYLFITLSSVVPLILAVRSIHKKKIESHNITQGTIEKRLITIAFSPQIIITLLSILAITLFNNVDIIFVKKFFSAQDAGIYSAWSLFAKMILFVSAPISSVGFILFSTKQTRSQENKNLMYSMILLLILGVISYLGYTLLTPLLIFIFFGSKFSAVAPYLGLASIFGSLYTAITFINNYFLAKKSAFALILPIVIIAYIVLLFMTGHNLHAIFNLNIFFSLAVTLIYIAAWIISLYKKEA